MTVTLCIARLARLNFILPILRYRQVRQFRGAAGATGLTTAKDERCAKILMSPYKENGAVFTF
jgi:hypothetical protein